MMTAARLQTERTVVIPENLLQVAPKLMKTKPVVSLARYLVDRQFWEQQ
jgi:hypothetical protein